MNLHPARFRTLTARGEARTAGVVWLSERGLVPWTAPFDLTSNLVRPTETIAAYGKACVYVPISTLKPSIEVTVYQDGFPHALVPCSNAAIAAAAHFARSGDTDAVQVAEPRSGLAYWCEVRPNSHRRLLVDSTVEFPLASHGPVVTTTTGHLHFDNYEIRLPQPANIEPQVVLDPPLLPDQRRVVIAKDRQVKFWNSHGPHGATPLTGIILLVKLIELGYLDSSLLPETIEGVYLTSTFIDSRPGMRRLILPERQVEFMEVNS